MEYFFEILKGTPWWVYLLFSFLLIKGWKARNSQVMAFKKIFLLPLFLVVWSSHSLIKKYSPTIFLISMFALFAAVGIFYGWSSLRSKGLKVDKKKALIEIPGTWATLIFSMVIFSFKYMLGVFYSLNPLLIHTLLFTSVDVMLSAGISGMFLGKLFGFCSQFMKATHTDLVESS